MTLRNAEDARRHAENWCAFHFGDLAPEAEREREMEFLQDPDACAELYRDLNLDACLTALAPPAAPPTKPRPNSRGRWPKFAIAVSVAVGVGALGWLAGRPSPPPSPPKEERCQPLEPRGAQAELPTAFRWTRGSDAASYRLVLSTQGGQVVHQATVSDTLYVLPAAVRATLSPAGEWSWSIEPRDAQGRPLPRSEVASFRLGG